MTIKKEEIVSIIRKHTKSQNLGSSQFFQMCLENLKSKTCPVIVSEFERVLRHIKELSSGCRSIESLHIEQKLKKASGDMEDLLFFHQISIAETPIITFKLGDSSRLAETILNTINE